MIHEHATELDGLPIEDYDPEKGIADPAGTAYRLRLDWDAYDAGKDFEGLMRQFLADPRAREVRGVVLGCWSYESTAGADEAVRLLAEAKLPELRAVFVGDIIGEEQEASWIIQTDLSPLLAAYPNLEYLRTRGNEGLSLGELRHGRLKTLIVETGGLSVDVVRQVCDSDLPALEHLELWLGTDNYGWTGGVEDLQPILSGRLFPKLRYLGLRDSEIADELAAVVANAPVVRRIETLDLSLGTMGDDGFRALLSLPTGGTLKKLDLHHHFASEVAAQELQARLPFEVDVSDANQPEDFGDGEGWRFVALSE